MLSFHDNILNSYTAACGEGRIVFHTKYPHSQPPEVINVVFDGVAAYGFENDLMQSGNILFEIEPIPLDEFVAQFKELLDKGKRHGWPALLQYQDQAELIRLIEEAKLTAYVIGSSMGLEGFILAQQMIIEAA